METTQPGVGTSASREVDYMEDKVQRDANLQVQWANWMSSDRNNSCYRRVFVLLLSWHPDCDDMDVEGEVASPPLP